MTSKQSVQTATSTAATVIPTTPTIKDSPAVERALNRSKLYLLVSWSLLYPEDEEFLDYLQCGEFVEDGRAALDALQAALDANQGGERAKLKLAADQDRIQAALRAKPDATLEELRQTLHLDVDLSTLCRMLQRLQITFKKSPDRRRAKTA